MPTEYAHTGAPRKAPAPLACEWCGDATELICTVQLLDRAGTEQLHVVCPECNEAIAAGLAEGQRYRAKVREERLKFQRDMREKRIRIKQRYG